MRTEDMLRNNAELHFLFLRKESVKLFMRKPFAVQHSIRATPSGFSPEVCLPALYGAAPGSHGVRRVPDVVFCRNPRSASQGPEFRGADVVFRIFFPVFFFRRARPRC